MLIRVIKAVLLFSILALTIACYLPGLPGHFIFDDGANIGMNSSLKIESLDIASLWQAAFSGDAGLLKRPISMASFAVNYYFSSDAFYFKAVNLGIHLINGLLVFVFARLLFKLYFRIHYSETGNRASWIAIVVAAIWLLHPFNLTAVLYVVQRMTSLAAMFTLLGLALYFWGRQSLLDGKKSGFFAISTAIFVVTPLAAFSKESGALLPLFIFVSEAILLGWNTSDLATRRILVLMVSLSVAIPIIFGLFYVFNHPGLILSGYAWRDFSLTERLMTEARVLWFYLHMILLPSMTEMGLHHDDILISRSLLSPWTTLPAIAGLFLLAGGAFVARKKHPIITFGVAFFFIGHLLESTVIPLEIAFEYRNYLPMLGILLPLAYYAFSPQIYLVSLRVRRVAFIGMIILFAGLTAIRAHQWGDPLTMRILEVERHPNSVRANTDIGNLYNYIPPNSTENELDLYNKTVFYYRRAAEVSSTNVAGLTSLVAMNAERGLQVDASVVDELEHRLATAPFGPPNKNSLVALVRCIASGRCVVDSVFIDRLYLAILSNPTLTSDLRNQVVLEFEQIPVLVWSRSK